MTQDNTETGLIPVGDYALMTEPEVARELMEANIGEGSALTAFDLQRVRVPSQGMLAWDLTELGREPARALHGIVVAWTDGRQFWRESFEDTGGKTPPDCRSDDLITGVGDPGGECARCPFNAWGTAEKGSGKACRETRALLIVVPDSLLPILLVVPPSSLKSVRKYFLGLATSQRRRYCEVVTSFELEKDTSSTGVAYSQITPRMARALDDEQRAAFVALAEQWGPIVKTVAVEREETEA